MEGRVKDVQEVPVSHKKKCDCEFCQIERLRSALQVIHTWATFNGGSELVPQHVANLCGKVLAQPSRNP